jgi:O2-independent ubiquinone biosynthesis protein UbiV
MKKPARKKPAGSLTLGPLFFHWPAEKRRDFYFRIAEEADLDCVYLGEVVCSKREPFFEPYFDAAANRLRAAGKTVVLSTLALVTSERELAAIKSRVRQDVLIEANDVACLQAIGKRPHVIGPFINVFNEGARDFLIRNGAVRIVVPVEANAAAIEVLANKGAGVEIEVMVFGRQPLSVAMRCYHARSHGLNKDCCQFVCGFDADGLPADTLDGQKLLTVNGMQTMSHGYAVYLHELRSLIKMGVSHFRLSPQAGDMVKIAALYRNVLKGKTAPDEALAELKELTSPVPFVNGFLHAREGLAWVESRKSAQARASAV